MKRRDEIITGVFVLLGVGLIVVGALWLSESRWRGDFRQVEARFSDVGQLKTGNSVTVRGVQVGRVQDIAFQDGAVRVTLRLEADAPLPEQPVVILHPLSLFGDWGASVEPGREHPGVAADTAGLEPGVLPGRSSTDFARLSEHAQEIASNMRSITDRLELALNEETARNLARSVENFERASTELVSLLERQRESFGGFAEDMAAAGTTLRESAADLDSTVSRLERATAEGELEEIFDHTRTATANLSQVTGDLRGTAADVRAAVLRADSALSEAEAVFARINRGQGSLGRMTTDPVLYEDLLATLTELRSLLDDLKTHPGKYFKFSIF